METTDIYEKAALMLIETLEKEIINSKEVSKDVYNSLWEGDEDKEHNIVKGQYHLYKETILKEGIKFLKEEVKKRKAGGEYLRNLYKQLNN